MLYAVTIMGIRPLLMHSGAGIDPDLPANIEKEEILRKRTTTRTESETVRLHELECRVSIWVDENERPTIPAMAIRASLEAAARRLRQGPQVREGMSVLPDTIFEYDEDRYGTTLDELVQSTQFRSGVVVQRQRFLRTRARFDLPWACTFRADCDDELVDQRQLESWLEIAGRRIGLGDWRPEKSGDFGRFEIKEIKAEEE